jgi:hypothetical protein
MNSKGIGKNFIIAFLMILAIYQTAELWFEDFSSHNFFSFADKNTTETQYDGVSHTLERIIINLGDNKMLCRENGIYDSEYKKKLDNAVSRLLRKGEVISEGQANWRSILQSRCIVYEYSFALGKEETESFFGVSGSNTQQIKSFDTIVISNDNSGSRVRLINSQTLWCIELLGDERSVANDITSVFDSFENSDDSFYYISSVQNGFEIFKGNIFIPRWDGQRVSYSYLAPSLQYDASADKSELESQVNRFFDNPARKWSTNVNGVLNYSDETTVVKYYPSGVLEYSDYSTNYGNSSSSTDNDFYNNYISALNILKKDAGIINEYYLRSYTFSGGQYVMYFGYKAGNLSVAMSSELKEATGMDDYIEVTVSDGRVSHYKRYCVAYSLEAGESMSASCDFLYAVDEVYNSLMGENEDAEALAVDGLKLSYVDKGDGEHISLWWLVNIDGNEHIIDAGVE